MEQRTLGHSGLTVSRLALGTMSWGDVTDAEEAANQLVAFVDAGGTLIDTADVYNDGETERILGKILEEVVPREDIILATKAVALRNSGPFGGGAGRGALLRALEGSLHRLNVDHIDLWQLHAWDGKVPIEETLHAIDMAVGSGKVRYVGVSNYTGWQTATAALAQRSKPAALVSNQVEYSLVERGIEREVIPAAGHCGLGILAYAPLGRGVLTGKYRNGTPANSRGANPKYAGYVEGHRNDRANRIVQSVMTAAEGLAVSPVALSLAWVRDQPQVTSVIIGARDLSQLNHALASESLTLPTEIRAALDDVSALELGYPERDLG
jgi:aryl-alcohol dehydrogenase-like predicted oxidoreductase